MPTPAVTTPESAADSPRLSWSRRTLFVGGALLSLSFFLPTLKGCNAVVPAELVAEFSEGIQSEDFKNEVRTTEDKPRFLLQVSSLLVSFVCPYLHGFLVLCGACFMWRNRHQKFGKALLLFIALAAIGTVLGPSIIYVAPPEGEVVFREWAAPFILAGWLVVGLCILGARNVRETRGALLWMALAGALPDVGWFAYQCGTEDFDVLGMESGWYVGSAGTLLLLTGAVMGLADMRQSMREARRVAASVPVG